MEFVLATTNPGKVRELNEVLGSVGLRCVSLGEASGGRGVDEPAEDEATFAGNALAKARGYAGQLGRAVIADDSGLVVDALGGLPGVLSARYAAERWSDGGAGADRASRDALNNAKLMEALSGVAAESRGARFVCSMVACDAEGVVLAESEGVFEGRIGEPPMVPRGGNGFGYDPVFLVAPGFLRTSAELSGAEKNALSHRGSACRALASRLRGV